MAYFHCLIGGGSSGGGYELTVTCDADFAGTTITCTDGVTTLTQTCPSASPYEVVFEIPNGGDWTISGVVAGHTVSTGVNIPTSAELIATIQQTITIHSAKEDTISYTDIDGATQTITFAGGATSKQVQITINLNGSSITFTSSVAKNPNNLSQDYSKTFTITPSTTDIYLMPDDVKTLYWWGYESDNFEDASNANGWSRTQYTLRGMTHNTYNLLSYPQAGYYISAVGTKNQVSASKFHAISTGIRASGGEYGDMRTTPTKAIDVPNSRVSLDSTTMTHFEGSVSISGYTSITSWSDAQIMVYAFWYE